MQLCAEIQTHQSSGAGECPESTFLAALDIQGKQCACDFCGLLSDSRNQLFRHLRAEHGLKTVKIQESTSEPRAEKAQVDSVAETEDYWTQIELKLHSAPDRLHERILFASHWVHVETDTLKLTEKDYLQDKEFKIIYTMVKRMQKHSTDRVKHETTLSKIKTVQLPPISLSKVERRCKSLADQHYMENGLLYRRFQNRIVLCVPDIQRAGQERLHWKLFSEFQGAWILTRRLVTRRRTFAKAGMIKG